MTGPLYLLLMLAIFLGSAALITLFIAILWFGHWFEKRSTGATHGFLEVPPGAQSRPAASSALPPSEPPAPAAPP
jgi:hypothetical protein